MHRNRIITAVASLGAAVLLLAGCGSSGNSSSSAGGSDATSGAASGLSGTPIKVMQIFSGSGAGFAGFDHTVAAAKAATAAVNASGGVKGHPLVLETCNDQFQPNVALQCGRKAVSDKVSAVVGAYSGLGDNWMPALTKAGIPCIGCAGYSQSESTSPMFFPIGASGGPMVVASGIAACALGAKSPAIAYVGHASGAFLAGEFNTGLKACNKKADEIAVTQGAADFTAWATQASSHDVVDMVIGDPDINKMRAGIAATGKTPAILDSYENFNSDYQKAAPSLNSKAYLSSAMVPAYTDDPAVKQYNDEIDKYGSAVVKDRRSDSTEVAWAAVHIVADMLGKAPATDPASLVKYMQTQKNVQFGPSPGVDWTAPVASFKPLVVYSTKAYFAKIVGQNKLAPAFKGGFIDISGGLPTPAS